MAKNTGQFSTTLLPGQKAAFQIEGLTEQDMQECRVIVEGFYARKGSGNPTSEANTALSSAVNCIRIDKDGNKREWFNAPGKAGDLPRSVLMKRLTLICGKGFKQYLNGTPTASPVPKPAKNALTNKPGTNVESPEANMITEHDLKEMSAKKKAYINEFGFSASSDIALLDRLVRIEVVVNKWETALITGQDVDSKAADSIKKLTDSMLSLQRNLGITAEQRSKLKSQNKEGTVAELFQQYQDTKREWPEIEQKFLHQELHMLLNKYNRTREDGNREISAPEFKRLSGGISVSEACKVLGKVKLASIALEEEKDE